MLESEVLWGSDERAIIEPRRGKRERALPPRAVFLFVSEDVAEFCRHVQTVHPPRSYYLSSVYSLECTTAYSVVGPLLGAPQAVMVLEKLIALGVREVIALGWCGALLDGVKIGDLVVPSRTISEEGTSSHYPLGPDAPPCECPLVFRLLLDKLATQGAVIHEGTVWTTDAPYRETVGKVIAYRRRGVLAVDMEASALIQVARFRGVACGMLLIVSDSLSSLRWVPGMKTPAFRETRQMVIETLASLLVCENADHL